MKLEKSVKKAQKVEKIEGNYNEKDIRIVKISDRKSGRVVREGVIVEEG